MKKEIASRRKEKGAMTKARLFEVAGDLFGQHDFADVSIDDIVDAAGVSKGTFYVHFPSKDALIAAFVSEYVSGVDADYQSHLDSLPHDTPAGELLLSLIEKITDVLTGVIGYHRMNTVYKVLLTGALDMEAVMGYDRQLYQIFAGVLTQGIQRREFSSSLSPEILTRHFVMAIRGLSYEWCVRYPDFDLRDQALVHFNILLRGIRAGETASPIPE